MPDPRRLADHWLQRCYGFPLRLAGSGPVAETAQAWLFSVAQLPVPGAPPVTSPAPMLTALVCVPKNGAPPFHPATDDPWADLAGFDRDPRPRDPVVQARRTNARGCVLAAHAAISGAPAPAPAPPWRPEHESAGWWNEFIRGHFPTAEVGPCADWDTVIRAVGEPGPDTRGVVWLRRELNGAEATGHLLYAHNDNGRVVLLDPQARRLARLETTNVRQLVLARIGP
ncbi:toxin glutamine deamidase domain-containing protein [Actinoallomurus sp. CA-142502]|uniref:toxin glutamine deamidase domain-containing protein n=1 Tax=Actinoallomurus sp. CA-142502 TaxID=3239885 RepID=UPI003D8B91F6